MSYSYLQPPARPVSTSTRGPKVLTFSGVACLVLALGCLALAITRFISLIPTGVVDSDGGPGSKVVLAVQPGQQGSFTAQAGERYDLWIVHPSSESPLDPPAPTVTGPGGTVTLSTATAGGTATSGSWAGEAQWQVQAASTGSYTVAAPAGGTAIYVVPGTSFGGFFGGLSVTLLAWAGMFGFGFLGLALGIAGGVWWAVRAGNRRRATAPPGWGPGYPGGPYPGGPPAA